MVPKPFKSVAFEWLSEAGDAVAGTRDRSFGEAGWLQYPMPAQDGKGGYEALDLTLGMTFVQTVVEFSPSVLGKLLPLMDVEAELTEPTFQAMAVRGARGGITETYPPARLAISPGIDLFRYTSHYRFNFTADASFSGGACHVSVGRTVLDQLVGATVAQALLDGLDIAQPPSVAVRQVPLHVSNILFSAAISSLSGLTRKLYCQAKCLEYLAALVQFVCASAEVSAESSQRSRNRSQALHAKLLSCEGKVPTLDELAVEFGRSAKLLNEEFAQEFGKSIYAFITEHRLSQAHAALQGSNVTIKQLAAKLGYSHVNNFTSAFRNKFGYTPGSLRRR